jgi:hypothetical protein
MMVQPGQHLQRLRRDWTDMYTDQHGRRFCANYDKENLAPVEELRPVDFDPPWLPPMRFAKFAKNQSFKFAWDYASMSEELGQATAVYYDEAVKVALSIPGDVPVPEPGGPVDRRIRAMLGAPPLSPALPIACQHGDPWLLGVKDAEPTSELVAIVQQGLMVGANETLRIIKARIEKQIKNPIPSLHEVAEPVTKTAKTIHDLAPVDVKGITYQQFVSECKNRDMKMPDIVAAWHEHKANLAADSVAA